MKVVGVHLDQKERGEIVGRGRSVDPPYSRPKRPFARAQGALMGKEKGRCGNGQICQGWAKPRRSSVGQFDLPAPIGTEWVAESSTRRVARVSAVLNPPAPVLPMLRFGLPPAARATPSPIFGCFSEKSAGKVTVGGEDSTVSWLKLVYWCIFAY